MAKNDCLKKNLEEYLKKNKNLGRKPLSSTFSVIMD